MGHGARPVGRRDLRGLHVAGLPRGVHGFAGRVTQCGQRPAPRPAHPNWIARRDDDLVRVLPASRRPPCDAHLQNLLHRQAMTVVAPSLEIAVIVLGVLVLLFETFADQVDKRTFAYTAMLGLATVFVATFFLPSPATEVADTGFWSFYTEDALAIFFKRFSLVTTILVLA